MSFRSKLKPKSGADAIEEEARKLKENEETALVLQQFIETFEEPVNVHKAWVKGGTVTPGSSVQSYEGAGRMYQPYQKTVEKAAEKLKEKLQPEIDKMSIANIKKEQAKKKSNLEAFSEELKQIQQEREMRMIKKKAIVERVEDIGSKFKNDFEAKPSEESRKSRFDNQIVSQMVKMSPSLSSYPYDLDNPFENENDRTSTNLFLGNLNPDLSEQQLCELFGRFGPLASIKIMWPRSDEEKSRGRNCGFVAFMNRNDGERALDKLRGQEICGYEMKLGWGKTVLIPPQPIYVPPSLQEMLKAPPSSGLPFNAQPRDWLEKHEKGIHYERKIYDSSSMSDEELTEILKSCVVKIVIPADRMLMQLINRMVEFVVREGVDFEAFIMNKEMRNPHFRFLFDFQTPEHIYYRWKLYSVLHGDSVKAWKTAEFQMYVDGPMWRPPPLNPYTSGMPEELITDFDVSELTLENIKSENQPTQSEQIKDTVVPNNTCMENPYIHNNIYKKLLSDSQQDRLVDMLTNIEPTKACIGEIMVWCLEHADSAEEVVDVVSTQLQRCINDSIESTNNAGNLSRIVAHIFLLSDILHNSCAKVRNASYYRKFIENDLSQIMHDYNRYYVSITSKLKSEQLKHKVLSCFRAWGDWYVYPYDFLLKLQNQFLGISEPVVEKSEEKTEIQISVDNMLNNKPLVDYDGDPLDLDGVPLDSNASANETCNEVSKTTNDKQNIIDMFANPNSPISKNAPLFVPSKWETVDPIEEESEMSQSRWNILESQMDENKSNEDNDDPDGFPLSDNDDGYELSKAKPSESERSNNDQAIVSKSLSSLVSYEKESSEEDDVTIIKEKESPRKDRREPNEDNERQRRRDRRSRSPKRAKYRNEDSPIRKSHNVDNVEVRSKVIKLDHYRDGSSSGRSSRRSPPKESSRDKGRDWDNKKINTHSDRRKRSRTRSRSRSIGKRSYRRRSKEKRR